MEKNKTGKYLKYAIGEIILVVFGILIALQINNWNEKRISKIKEHKLLITVLENIKTDSTTINNIIEREEEIEAVHKQLIRLERKEINSNSINNLDPIRRTFSNQFVTHKNNPNLSNLLLDEEVKKIVLNHYLLINRTEYKLQSYNEIIEQDLRPFLGNKSLLIFGNQFEELNSKDDRLINEKGFLQEFQYDELKQLLFEAGIKLESFKGWTLSLNRSNENLKRTILDYLARS